MAGRPEVGSFGFVRHPGGDNAKGQIKGVGGHARAPNSGGLTAHRQATPAEGPSQVFARPPALGGYASRSAPPPFTPPQPNVPAKLDEGSLQTALEEWKDVRSQIGDLDGVKTRFDDLFLRINNQDTALKSLERSTSALRQEYSSVSQSTDSQLGPRLDALERSLGRLEAAFQDFSSRLDRRVNDVESAGATAATSAAAGAVPYDATALAQLAPDLPALSRVFLFLPMTKEADGSVSMQRRSLDAQGRPQQTTVKVQSPSGEPLVVFA